MAEPRAVKLAFDASHMWVHLSDGGTLGVPLSAFPRLLSASPGDLAAHTISGPGLHWEELNEDISVAHLLLGYGAHGKPFEPAG